MGDPKKSRKKYSMPLHPWIMSRIEDEHALKKDYGLKNMREIWKVASLLRNFKHQAKGIAKKPREQIQKEQKLLIEKLARLKLLPASARVEDILGLKIKDILERRLQTVVYRQNLARTMRQARQFITHGHIMVNSRKTNVPSYLVDREEEGAILFVPYSSLSDKDHPERIIKIENTKITKIIAKEKQKSAENKQQKPEQKKAGEKQEKEVKKEKKQKAKPEKKQPSQKSEEKQKSEKPKESAEKPKKAESVEKEKKQEEKKQEKEKQEKTKEKPDNK